jgi:GAF domain-containing protein
MPFAAGLHDSLQSRDNQVPIELANGESLKDVLSKYLLAAETVSEPDVITSILLLSGDGKRLFHGAAPKLPQTYCDAVDGSEIGRCAGSCGTAAYYGRPVYVSDIASDPLWANYRHIALPHGLRSCWSTPIRDQQGEVIGTFAVYRPVVGDPSDDAIQAIELITEHVARAIAMARNVQDRAGLAPRRFEPPRLKLVASNEPEAPADDRSARLLELAEKMESRAADLDGLAERTDTLEAWRALRTAADLSRKVAETIRAEVDNAPNKGEAS